MDRRGSEPRVLASGIPAPGGLAFLAGRLAAGRLRRLGGDRARRDPPQAGLLRVDPKTGEQRPYASGLTMSNGVTRGPDGAVYASNDFGPGIDRVLDGEVTLNWAAGRVVERARGRQRPERGCTSRRRSSRGDLARRARRSRPTSRPGTRRPRPTPAAILDGLTRDAHDRLYVAANLGGEVWRVQEGGPGLRPRPPAAARPERGRLRHRAGTARAAARRASAAATSTSSPSRAT